MNWWDFVFGIFIGIVISGISQSIHASRQRLARLDRWGHDPLEKIMEDRKNGIM